MSIVRVGSSAPYAAGWDHIFGGSKVKGGAKTRAKKTVAKKTVAQKASRAKATKKKPGRTKK